MRISDWSSDVCSSDLLAIECDGDRYHGPEQWPADMQRQRTLERAGWRFWRCFASRFVREQQTVLEELCKLLDSLDIKPRAADKRSTVDRKSVVQGKSVSVRVALCGRRIIKKKTNQ